MLKEALRRGPSVSPSGTGGSKMEKHHFPPYMPEYWVRFRAPADRFRYQATALSVLQHLCGHLWAVLFSQLLQTLLQIVGAGIVFKADFGCQASLLYT